MTPMRESSQCRGAPRIALVAFVASLLLLLGACAETSTGASRVRAGDLYAPGQDRYDDYFAAVHSQQATSAQWPSDRKTSHQAITEALKLDSDASNDDIERAAQAKHSSKAVAQAVEKTAHSDGERAKDLLDMAAKIDELIKTGHDLEGHVSEDFEKPASGAKGPSPSEVKMELHASYDVLAKIRDHAKDEAKSAEDLIVALQQKPGKETHAPSKHGSTGKPAPAATAATAPASQPAAAAPQPKPQPAGEVFQP